MLNIKLHLEAIFGHFLLSPASKLLGRPRLRTVENGDLALGFLHPTDEPVLISRTSSFLRHCIPAAKYATI